PYACCRAEAAEQAIFFDAIRSAPNRIVHCATESNKASNTSRACSSSRCVTGGQPGRLRMIIVIVDQLNLLARHATISPYSHSGSTNGSIASIFTSDSNESAATTLLYSLLTANRFTVESLSLPARLSARTSLCACV